MGLLSKFFNNTRKPEGFLGKMMVNGMNGGGHARMAEWALSSIPTAQCNNALDVGCGGGANIKRLLERIPHVAGIDYSAVSVDKSKDVNTKAIAAGRCQITEASVDKLPFEENSFDLVTAFETIYFWPDIENCFREVKRTLKAGGNFAIINESDGNGSNDAKWESMIEGMHTYKPEEIRTHLTNAGFREINIQIEESKHWLLATAVKHN